MELYFAPVTCSMAARIALDEAGAEIIFTEVDRPTKRILATGANYLDVNPAGYVPALKLDDGTLITEVQAILQYIADAYPAAKLAPPPEDLVGRAKLRQWLAILNGELHKGFFTSMVRRDTPAEVRAWTANRYLPAFARLDAALAGREFLLDHFTVADAYLVVMLGWTNAVPEIDLKAYPNLVAYRDRLRARPSVARAIGVEIPLFKAEMARQKAA